MLTNYYELSQKLLSEVNELNKKNGYKAKLVIHGCCAPCSCYPIEVLDAYFDITILYTNSNIYPESEYQIRFQELVDYIASYNEIHNSSIQLVALPYDNATYTTLIKKRGSEKEGQETCHLCYQMRLKDTFDYALQNGLTYAGTVMSISRQKNSKVLNEIGLLLEKEYPTIKFLIADFKKKGGQERRDILSKDMYKQQYCGCVFSYQEYLNRNKTK